MTLPHKLIRSVLGEVASLKLWPSLDDTEQLYSVIALLGRFITECRCSMTLPSVFCDFEVSSINLPLADSCMLNYFLNFMIMTMDPKSHRG